MDSKDQRIVESAITTVVRAVEAGLGVPKEIILRLANCMFTAGRVSGLEEVRTSMKSSSRAL